MPETKKINSQHVGAIAFCAVVLLGLTFLKNGFHFVQNSVSHPTNEISQESYSSINRTASENLNNIASLPAPEVLGASTTTTEITDYPASEKFTNLHPRGQ